MTILNLNISKDITAQIKRLVEIKRQLAELDERKKRLEGIEDELKPQIIEWLRNNNYKSWQDDEVTLTLKDSYIRRDFDKARFQKENPDAYNQYLKDTTVKETMSVKIKG